MTHQEMLDAIASKRSELKALNDLSVKENRDFTEAEEKSWSEGKAEIFSLEKRAARQKEVDETEVREAQTARQTPMPKNDPVTARVIEAVDNRAIPEEVRRFKNVKNFSGETRLEKELAAYRFGLFYFAMRGNQKAAERCKEIGIDLRGLSENTNSTGGFLVPDEFSTTLIDLRETYGVFRRIARNWPMTSDVLNVPTVTGSSSAVFLSEGGTLTETNPTYGQVKLVAKKLGAITVIPNELSMDAVIAVGDFVMGDLARAISYKEDYTGFNGDGTQTYGGIIGVIPSITNISSAEASVAATSGSDDDWGAIVLGDFNKLMGVIPQYANVGNARFVCSQNFFATVMQRLMFAAGGNTVENLLAGTGKSFFGYPVEISQVLPTAGTTAEIVCLFGDFSQSCAFGDRMQVTLEESMHATVGSTGMFETDQKAIRAIERIDINVHNMGDSTTAGSISGMLTAA